MPYQFAKENRDFKEFEAMKIQYNKPSHTAASVSLQRLNNQLREFLTVHQIRSQLFSADATDSQALTQELKGRQIDIVIADVPYGRQSNWQSTTKDPATNESLLWPMLNTLSAIIADNTIVAIIANKTQKCKHERYKRMDQFQIGKRRITLLQLTHFPY